MNKFSTPEAGAAGTCREGRRAEAPRQMTLAFLRQFARTYTPGPRSTMPGIVLN